MRKVIFVVTVIAVAGVCAGFAYQKFSPAKQDTAQAQTAPVKKGDIRVTVTATGVVQANLTVDVKCKAAGTLIRMPKHGEVVTSAPDAEFSSSALASAASNFGLPTQTEPVLEVADTVKKGQLLLELDPLDMLRIRAQASVQLETSTARLAAARTNLEMARHSYVTDKLRADSALVAAQVKAADAHAKAVREEALLAKSLVAPEDVETARTAAAQADNDLENAKVRVQEVETEKLAVDLREQELKQAMAAVESDKIDQQKANDSLAYTRVYAPMDGVVSALNVQLGQIIASAVSNVGGGTTVLTLSDLSQIFVLASVDESEIGGIREGGDQAVNITSDAFRGQRFRGKVSWKSPAGVNVSNVVTFQVRIEVTGRGKEQLRPGMTTNVEIVAEEHKDVLIVPTDALASRDGKKFVTVVADSGKQEERTVEVGLTNTSQAEIVSGLKEGELIVVQKAADSKWNAGQQRFSPPNPFGGAGGGGGRMGGGGRRG